MINKKKLDPVGSSREVLLKGKAQYGWPPCTNQFRSAPFYIENIINLFYKTSYLNEEVNCTEPSPLAIIPWLQYKKRVLVQNIYNLLLKIILYNHRHLSNIDWFIMCTACLVCLISTVNGHNKNQKRSLGRAVLVAGT